MAGLVPAIHKRRPLRTERGGRGFFDPGLRFWVAGTSPAMTIGNIIFLDISPWPYVRSSATRTPMAAIKTMRISKTATGRPGVSGSRALAA
jgi:hypothetical protein